MENIVKGQQAPDFNLTDRTGKVHSLRTIKEDFVVLFFYPKDDTPGCTTEALGFEADMEKYRRLNAAVVGISGGTDKTKAKFCDKHGLEKILLLTDGDFSLAKAYESYGEKMFMGKKYLGILRQTFVLDKERRIVEIVEKVDPKSHSAEVLELIRLNSVDKAA